MRIAINGKSLGIVEKGGAVRVALSLIRWIALERPDFTFDLYIPVREGYSQIPNVPSNVTLHLSCSALYGSGLGRSLWEQIILPYLVGRRKYDLLLNLTNSAPVTLSPGLRQILLVHDWGFRNREWYSTSFSIYLTLLIRLAAARGIRFVTVSRASAAQLMEMFPSLRQVEVIYNAAEDPLAAIKPANLGYRYILFIGSINPRKNIVGAVSGFDYYRRSTAPDVKLVIVGARKPFFSKMANTPWLSNGIVYMGYIDDARKWSLLEGAELLLMPSFMEGFGLPIVEAFGVGTPVVASDIPVFKELYGNAIFYVNPHSPVAIGRGIQTVMEDKDKTKRMIMRGKEIALRFSWKTAAEKYVMLFKNIIQETQYRI